MLDVNFNQNASLTKIRDVDNCIAFFGSLNEMSFGTPEGKQLVLFDFKGDGKVLLTFYTYHSRFYFIIVGSKGDLDESSINLLNLQE